MVAKRTAEDCHLLVYLDAYYKNLFYCLLHIFKMKKSLLKNIFL